MHKFKSIKASIARTINNLGLGDKDIPWLDMIEWISDALQQIGAYSQYVEKYRVELEVDESRAKLPCDFYKPIENPGLVYKIVGDTLLLANYKQETVKFNYIAFMVDDEGFPMIPDIVSYDEAIQWRIAMQLAIRDELPNKKLSLEYCTQLWHLYAKQARAKANAFSEDEKAVFARNFLTLMPDIHQYGKYFSGVNNDSRIYGSN